MRNKGVWGRAEIIALVNLASSTTSSSVPIGQRRGGAHAALPRFWVASLTSAARASVGAAERPFAKLRTVGRRHGSSSNPSRSLEDEPPRLAPGVTSCGRRFGRRIHIHQYSSQSTSGTPRWVGAKVASTHLWKLLMPSSSKTCVFPKSVAGLAALALYQRRWTRPCVLAARLFAPKPHAPSNGMVVEHADEGGAVVLRCWDAVRYCFLRRTALANGVLSCCSYRRCKKRSFFAS